MINVIDNMVSVEDELPTNSRGIYLVKCPNWCDMGFQICEWFNGKREFDYADSPNDMFHECVTHWVELEVDSY